MTCERAEAERAQATATVLLAVLLGVDDGLGVWRVCVGRLLARVACRGEATSVPTRVVRRLCGLRPRPLASVAARGRVGGRMHKRSFCLSSY